MTMAQLALDEALSHLAAAVQQTVPTDDQIIMDHVRAAHTLLTVVTRAQRESEMQKEPA